MDLELMPFPGHEPKEQVLDDTPMRIGALEFGVMSTEEIELQAEQLEISDKNLYDLGPTRTTTRHGPLDTRLGTTTKSDLCETCGRDQKECNGHWGFVRLELPCYHIGYLGFTIEILNTICKSCARVLLDESRRRFYIRALRRPDVDSFMKRKLIKSIRAECGKIKFCSWCDASNGPVRKVNGHACKVIHLAFDAYNKSTAKSKQPPPDKIRFDSSFTAYVDEYPDHEKHVKKAVDDMQAWKTYFLFRRIEDADCELLGIDFDKGRPESYLWTHLPVPPTNIRPSVPGDQGTTEDELTTKLSEIIDINVRLRSIRESNDGKVGVYMELYERLQDYIAMYINSSAPGLNKTEYGKAIRSFCSRLKGKQGRFRGNLSGKRVNFSGRTVIGPDPNLSVEEVGVPVHVAKILTYGERVTAHNLKWLRTIVANGHDVYPGANQIRKKRGNTVSLSVIQSLGGAVRLNKVSSELEIGDIVDRHLKDGDIVLFNRQPSLHKLSILSHFAKVLPGRTFRMNESVCNPYNADFDGDEMNLHVPQTEEARIEARELMGVKHNIVTPKNGTPIIAPIQDFITGCYLLSLKDTFFDRGQFGQLMCQMFDAAAIWDPITKTYTGYDLPPPAIVKPKRLWTGKQLYGVMMRPNKQSNVRINLETACKWFRPVAGRANDMDENDQWLVIRNSEIMCGVVDKSIIGDGKKSTIVYAMLREYGEDCAVQAMNRIAKVTSRWLAKRGFSIGLGDVTPSEKLNREKERLMGVAYEKSQDIILQYKEGRLPHDPGCDEEQTMENKVSGILSQVRQDVGNACMETLSRHNAPVTMAKAGSKGSLINVSQMVGSVGQQMIGGKRVANGFHDRTLPHFPKGARDPAAKGFIANSFHSGLKPTEFIFHAMSGREGLVDTAVKTAETGYMSRRLIKSLEDAHVAYDKTVRDSSGKIMEFSFGDDDLDPAELEGKGKPVDFERTWLNSTNTTYNPTASGLTPGQIQAQTSRFMIPHYRRYNKDKSPKELMPTLFDEMANGIASEDYDAAYKLCQEVVIFLRDKIVHLNKLRAQYMLHPDATTRNGAGVPAAQSETKALDADRETFDQFSQAVGIDPGRNRKVVDNIMKVTKECLDKFLNACMTKYYKAVVQPGHAVGAIAAQSIGEPGTQMTLKTFHFAGVAGMSITQGVPRIKEIINAAKKISTPIISVELENKVDVRVAQVVKARLEKTYLKDIAEHIEDVWGPTKAWINIRFDLERMQKLHLDVSLEDIARSIIKTKGMKLDRRHVEIYGTRHIRVSPPQPDSAHDEEVEALSDPEPEEEDNAAKGKGRKKKKKSVYFVEVQEYMRALQDVIIKGHSDAHRVVIKRSDTPNAAGLEELQLFVEGYGLKQCMITEGVNGIKCKTNSVLEVYETLGIEAAKSTIISEIKSVMSSMDIDNHHIQLLATCMTNRGEITGITRFGLAKSRDSVLQLASFEKTPDHLFEAASGMKQDSIEGVSENIIMGQPVRLGTGMTKVVMPLNLSDEFRKPKNPFISFGVDDVKYRRPKKGTDDCEIVTRVVKR